MAPDPSSAIVVPEVPGIVVARSSGKCCSKGCPLDRAFVPVLLLRCKRRPQLVVRAVVDVGLCADHKAVTTVRDLVTNDGWNTIFAAFDARRARGDRSAAAGGVNTP